MNVCLNLIARQKYFTVQLNIQESAAEVSGMLTLKLVNQATFFFSDIIFLLVASVPGQQRPVKLLNKVNDTENNPIYVTM